MLPSGPAETPLQTLLYSYRHMLLAPLLLRCPPLLTSIRHALMLMLHSISCSTTEPGPSHSHAESVYMWRQASPAPFSCCCMKMLPSFQQQHHEAAAKGAGQGMWSVAAPWYPQLPDPATGTPLNPTPLLLHPSPLSFPPPFLPTHTPSFSSLPSLLMEPYCVLLPTLSMHPHTPPSPSCPFLLRGPPPGPPGLHFLTCLSSNMFLPFPTPPPSSPTH